MDISKLQSKKIYELILSSKEASTELKSALQCIVRRSMQEACHFEFLLHRIDWFSYPFREYLNQMQRVIRLYRGKGKEAAKVAYNLLIQNLSLQSSNLLAIQSLISLVNDAFHSDIILQCLKQNYPHKESSLSMHAAYLDSLIIFYRKLPKYRFELLEAIIENLVYFDTEILTGENYWNKHFPDDEKIKSNRESSLSQIAFKYDALLCKLTSFLLKEQKDELLFKSLFQIFQNKILPIKSTKLAQFLIFALAESNKKMSSSFISLLLSNILESDITKQNWYRIFTQSNFYLVSYLIRSKVITLNKITQVLAILITYLTEKLEDQESKPFNERLKLKQSFFNNQKNLHILQSILTICAYEPAAKIELLDSYQNLIKMAQAKLHFKYFINEELLIFLKLVKPEDGARNEATCKLTLKYSNKFNPVILPKLATIIDPLFKWTSIKFNIDKEELGRKSIKKVSEEDHTFCSASDTQPASTKERELNA